MRYNLRPLMLLALFCATSAFLPGRSTHPLGELVSFTFTPTQYEKIILEDKPIIQATAGNKTASGLLHFTPIDCLSKGKLNWRWQVLDSHSSVDIEDSNREDFTASIHLIFSERVGNDFYKSDYDMLSYVWAQQDDAIGSIFQAPAGRSGNHRRILLQNKASPAHQWKNETRIIVKDFMKAFGKKPEYPLRAIMLFTDNDQTAEPAKALYDIGCFIP